MHRPLVERVFAALLLGWFAIVLGEPAALHSCPMHGAPASATAHVPDTAEEATGHAHTHQAPTRQDDHRGCTCVGDCSMGAAVAAIPQARVSLIVTPLTRFRVELPAAASPSIAAPAFLRPYANGPPSGRRVA